MKKFILVAMAAIFAIAFSAFTTNAKFTTTFYQDDLGTWHSYTGTPCPAGSNPSCFVIISGVSRQLFNSKNAGDPYLRN